MQRFVMSDAGIAMTRGFEGLRLEAYPDSAGIWTVGYGHTGVAVKAGICVTEAEAEALLRDDLQDAVVCVNEHVTARISQGQFDALVDFCFNAGRGSFVGSTLLKRVNAGEFVDAASEFGLWCHAGGEVVEGLVRRRQAEAGMFAG